jgi:hypothetical protein
MKIKCKLVTALLLVGFGSHAQSDADFTWLVGTWKQKDKNSFEVWVKQGDFLLGKSFFIHNTTDTTVTETIRLIALGGGYYYVPDVAGPQEEVYFKLTKYSNAGFTAANPEHNFPKIISYTLVSPSALQATIEGNGKKKTYYFQRLN